MAFQGSIAELPIGSDGLYGTMNVSQVPLTALLRALNVTFENGTVQKEGGASKYNSTAITATPSILGGHDWNHNGSVQRMIVLTSAGDLLKDSGTGTFPVTLASGLTVSDVLARFVEGGKEAAANNRKLFIFTGKNQVQVLSADGATTSNLATPHADWAAANQPYFGVIHEGRLWGGGNANDPHRLYYSTTGNHEDFTGGGSGSIAVYPGEGERLVAGFAFGHSIIAFKYPKGIYLIDTSDPTVANWRVDKISGKVGSAGVACAVQVEDDVVFVDNNGQFRLLSATDQSTDVGTEALDDKAEMGPFIRGNMNRAASSKWVLEYHPSKREVHCACCGTGATTNNSRLVLDFNKPGKVRFRFSDRDTCVSMWVRNVSSVPTLYSGDNAGFVWEMDTATRSKDSAGYNGEFQTPHYDLSHVDPKLGPMIKNGKYLELVVDPQGNHNLSVDVYWDGQLHQTLQFNMGQTGVALGTFVLGTDRLGGSQVLNKKRKLTGRGRRISLVGRNSGAGQDFSISRFYLHFEVGGQTPGQVPA